MTLYPLPTPEEEGFQRAVPLLLDLRLLEQYDGSILVLAIPCIGYQGDFKIILCMQVMLQPIHQEQ